MSDSSHEVKPSTNLVNFYYRHGACSRDELIKILEQTEADYYWFDVRPTYPFPKELPIKAFYGRGAPDWSLLNPDPERGFEIHEMRLFYSDGGLHWYLNAQGQYAWFEFMVSQSNEPEIEDYASIGKVQAQDRQVLIRNIEGCESPAKMQRIDYIYQNQIIAWCLQDTKGDSN